MLEENFVIWLVDGRRDLLPGSLSRCVLYILIPLNWYSSLALFLINKA